jgi:mannose-6-phosphate isomerase-like protein (cupin superfamily)
MVRNSKRGITGENAEHNHDGVVGRTDRPPERDVLEADFAAEAHGFTGFERAGRGSCYGGSSSEGEERAMSGHILKGERVERTDLGDLRLARGDRAGLRLWQDYVTEDKTERTRPYEIVGYVIKGEITLIVEGHAQELVEGDSFVIPAETSHSFHIPMPATVIEATAPPAADEPPR